MEYAGYTKKELLQKVVEKIHENGLELDKKQVKKYNTRHLINIIDYIQSIVKLSATNTNPCIFANYVHNNYCNIKIDNYGKIKNLVAHRKSCCECIIDEILRILGKKEKDEITINTTHIKHLLENKNLKTSIAEYHHCYVYLEDMMRLFKSFSIVSGRLIYDDKYEIKKGIKWREMEEKINEEKRINPKIRTREKILSLYGKKDYNENLRAYYTRKIEGIHILSHFLEKLSKDTKNAMNLVNDYFLMKYGDFLHKYYKTKEQ